MNSFVLRKGNFEDPSVWSFYEKLSRKLAKTRDVARQIYKLADENLEKHFDGSRQKFIQLPMPVPVGHRPTLMLYLRLFLHERSPTYKPKDPNHHRRSFDRGDDLVAIERVREHLMKLITAHKHRPEFGEDLTGYLRRALALLDDPPEATWVKRQREEFRRRWEGY